MRRGFIPRDISSIFRRLENVVLPELDKCGDYLNYMYGYMTPSTGYLKDFNMFMYDGHFILQYPRYEYDGKIPEFKDEPTLAKVLKRAHKWAKLCNADLIAKAGHKFYFQTVGKRGLTRA